MLKTDWKSDLTLYWIDIMLNLTSAARASASTLRNDWKKWLNIIKI